jgi:U3 small nucleolar RNA-associated protein 13
LRRRRFAVTSSKDKTCRLWDLSCGRCLAVGEGHTEAVGAVAMSRRSSTNSGNNSAFFVSGAGDKILKKWNVVDKILVEHEVNLSVIDDALFFEFE